MTRKIVSAISAIFDELSSYVTLRGEAIPGIPEFAYRTIRGNADEEHAIANVVAEEIFRASDRQALGAFEYRGENFIGMMGFDFEPDLVELSAVDVTIGMGVVLLYEFKAIPKVSPLTVVNVVGEASSADDGYAGHEFEDLHPLFPSLQLFQVTAGEGREVPWPLLLKSAISEAARGGSWVGPNLKDAIYELAGLEAIAFPYPSLCRAVFDLDPRSLFMALYRCIEATYARDACVSLGAELKLSMPWYEIAGALDRSLGWRAPEASSINRTLEAAEPADLEAISALLNAPKADSEAVRAGRAIYRLRNKIVHFRAGDDQDYADNMPWELLCIHLARVVGVVYGAAFVVPASMTGADEPRSVAENGR